MATFTALITENVTVHTSSSVANAASVTDDIDFENLGIFAADLVVDLDIAGAAAGDVKMELFLSVDGGTTYTTVPFQTTNITFSGAAHHIVAIRGIVGLGRVRVKMTNSTGQSCTYFSKIAHLKEASA